MSTLKVVSWNLLHRAGASLDEVAELIQRETPDLMLMQEAAAPIDGLPSRVGGYYVRNPLPGRVHGLAAWSPSPLRPRAVTLHLQPGLFVLRLCQIISLDALCVANVHLSHSQLLNRRQLRRIADAMPKRAAILGDCNLVGAPLLAGFRDVGPRQPTHRAGGFAPLRLDRCFVRGLVCAGAKVLPRGASDHSPIVVRLSLPGQGE